jgi:hypothetical protein
MSWHFSRALVEAFSEESCSGGGPSAPLNTSPTHGMCWSPGRTTAPSSPSRSGMTFEPSTDGHGEALLTWCLGASRAKTSPVQARAPDWTGLVQDSGGRWHESLARFDPATSSWKTRQCSLLEGSTSFSETWPRWGLMLDGVSWALTMPARLTGESGSGSWPTPTAMDHRDMSVDAVVQAEENGQQVRLAGRARFATPTATANQMCPSMQKWPGCRAMWGTPTAHPRTHTPRDVDHGAQLANQVGGSLNPPWVEWLMGWPLGWTDCARSATDKYRQWSGSHGRP